MPFDDLERKRGRPTDETLLKIHHARKDAALQYHGKYFRGLNHFMNFYKGIWNPVGNLRNDVSIPLVLALAWSDVAHKVQTSFGSWPIVGMMGYPPEAAPIAAKNELLLSAQMKDAQMYEKAVDFYATADIYGDAWTRIGWRFDTEEDDSYRERILDLEFRSRRSVTVFDGPDIDVIDNRDVWTEASKKRLRDCGHIFIRYVMDLDDMHEENAAARERNEPPVWDPDGLRQIEERGIYQGADSRITDRLGAYRHFLEYLDRGQELYTKPVEVVEMWGLVPSEAAVDGQRNVMWAVGNDHAVLKLRRNPLGKRMFPVRNYTPVPDLDSIHGLSKVQSAMPLQAVANRLLNQKLDVMDLFINPQFVVPDNMNLAGDTWISRPGRLFKVYGANPSDIQPLMPDLRGVQLVGPEIENIARFVEQAMGVSRDTMAGFAGPGSTRETARGFLGRTQQAMQRVTLEARIAEEMWLEPTVNDMRRLNRRFLTVPKQIGIIGSAALMNPITGLPYPPELQSVDLDDLNADYQCRAVGATQMLTKQMRAQNLLVAQQQLSANPVLLQAMNWVNFGREILKALDLDPGQLLNSDIPLINLLAAQIAQGGGAPQAPDVLGGEGSSTLEALDPSILGAQNPRQLPAELALIGGSSGI